MSVPGRIGIILIIALALVDALILASGAKHAATAIETHAMVQQTAMQPELTAHEIYGDALVRPEPHKTLISAALNEINLFMAKRGENPAGI